MTDQQASELTKPCVGSLHDPAALITPQFAPIFVASSLIVPPVGGNQFNPSLDRIVTLKKLQASADAPVREFG